MLLLTVLGLSLLIGSPTGAAPAAPAAKPKPLAVDQLMFFAVLEGLYTDGVSTEAVNLIVSFDPGTGQANMHEHFVGGCPLCTPAFDAFILYRSRQQFYGRKDSKDTFGGGLDGSVLKKLQSAKQADRLEAIQGLIDRWVRQRLDSMRLSPEERAEWTRQIEAGREQGMRGLKGDPAHAGWKGCAICDGAAGACKKRN
jgi:hypothetical protein